MLASYVKPRYAARLMFSLVSFSVVMWAQSGGSSTSVTGIVIDPSGAVIPGASVEIRNAVSLFERRTISDGHGTFTIPNVPFNPYHLVVTAPGFAAYAQDVDVRSTAPVTLSVALQLSSSTESV